MTAHLNWLYCVPCFFITHLATKSRQLTNEDGALDPGVVFLSYYQWSDTDSVLLCAISLLIKKGAIKGELWLVYCLKKMIHTVCCLSSAEIQQAVNTLGYYVGLAWNQNIISSRRYQFQAFQLLCYYLHNTQTGPLPY